METTIIAVVALLLGVTVTAAVCIPVSWGRGYLAGVERGRRENSGMEG